MGRQRRTPPLVPIRPPDVAWCLMPERSRTAILGAAGRGCQAVPRGGTVRWSDAPSSPEGTMNTVKTTLLLGAMTGLLLAIGELLGGGDGLVLALLLVGVMNFASLFWSDKIVLRLYGARPVGREEAPELHDIVQALAQKAGIPMPRLYVIPDRALNAFATGRGPTHAAVAATEGILQAM